MSTVKFSSVQFGHDGIGLQFSRQCLMGYIHHYWVIAKSSCVLAGKVRDERERWVEGRIRMESVQEGWRRRKIKRYGLKTITGGFALVKLFTNL